MPVPLKVRQGLGTLKPLPATANRLIAALQKEDTSLSSVSEFIEYDQVIAGRVLRLARSAAYSGSMAINDVHTATMRLGTATILELVLGDYLRTLKMKAPLYDLDEDDLWAHGAASGLAVRALKQECPNTPTPEIAQSAALMHDIGKLVLVRTVQLRPTDVNAICEREKVTWVEAERRLIGCDHAEVGGLLARKWDLPEDLCRAIERHHDQPIADPDPVVDAVVFANYIAKSIGTGLGAEGLNIGMDPTVSQRLGVDRDSFDRICLQTFNWLKDLRRAVAA
ncbi:MAG: HDOD domain-containing protein [Acidobacteriota bacterium]